MTKNKKNYAYVVIVSEKDGKSDTSGHEMKTLPRQTSTTKIPCQTSHQTSFSTILSKASSVSQEVILARHGPYALSAHDFLSLSGAAWLTDQVTNIRNV